MNNFSCNIATSSCIWLSRWQHNAELFSQVVNARLFVSINFASLVEQRFWLKSNG